MRILLGISLSVVLIETSWNVKHDYWKERSGSATVLIETSWNVKDIQLPVTHSLQSINRNIVECKVIKAKT